MQALREAREGVVALDVDDVARAQPVAVRLDQERAPAELREDGLDALEQRLERDDRVAHRSQLRELRDHRLVVRRRGWRSADQEDPRAVGHQADDVEPHRELSAGARIAQAHAVRVWEPDARLDQPQLRLEAREFTLREDRADARARERLARHPEERGARAIDPLEREPGHHEDRMREEIEELVRWAGHCAGL